MTIFTWRMDFSSKKGGERGRNTRPDDEMQSRYERIHSENGLCFALVEVFNTLAELRMKAEYGDYLPYACSTLKGNDMDDMIWKIQRLDWRAVAAKIREEEALGAKDTFHHHASHSPTPYLDDIAKAASRLGYEESLVKF